MLRDDGHVVDSVRGVRWHSRCRPVAHVGLERHQPGIFASQRSRYNDFAQAVYCVTLSAVGFHHYGIIGALVAVAASDLPMYFCFQHAAFRRGINAVVQDMLLTGFFVAVLSGALLLRHALGFGSPFPAHLM
jgi:hypothetical protein